MLNCSLSYSELNDLVVTVNKYEPDSTLPVYLVFIFKKCFLPSLSYDKLLSASEQVELLMSPPTRVSRIKKFKNESRREINLTRR